MCACVCVCVCVCVLSTRLYEHLCIYFSVTFSECIHRKISQKWNWLENQRVKFIIKFWDKLPIYLPENVYSPNKCLKYLSSHPYQHWISLNFWFSSIYVKNSIDLICNPLLVNKVKYLSYDFWTYCYFSVICFVFIAFIFSYWAVHLFKNWFLYACHKLCENIFSGLCVLIWVLEF